MSDLNEVSPKGWGGTTSAMKKHHKEIDNPWALAYWMKKRDFKSHYKNDPKGTKSKKEPEKKEKYKDEDKKKKGGFKEWLELREAELSKAQKDNIKSLTKIKNPHGHPKSGKEFMSSLKDKMDA